MDAVSQNHPEQESNDSHVMCTSNENIMNVLYVWAGFPVHFLFPPNTWAQFRHRMFPCLKPCYRVYFCTLTFWDTVEKTCWTFCFDSSWHLSPQRHQKRESAVHVFCMGVFAVCVCVSCAEDDLDMDLIFLKWAEGWHLRIRCKMLGPGINQCVCAYQ